MKFLSLLFSFFVINAHIGVVSENLGKEVEKGKEFDSADWLKFEERQEDRFGPKDEEVQLGECGFELDNEFFVEKGTMSEAAVGADKKKPESESYQMLKMADVEEGTMKEDDETMGALIEQGKKNENGAWDSFGIDPKTEVEIGTYPSEKEQEPKGFVDDDWVDSSMDDQVIPEENEPKEESTSSNEPEEESTSSNEPEEESTSPSSESADEHKDSRRYLLDESESKQSHVVEVVKSSEKSESHDSDEVDIGLSSQGVGRGELPVSEDSCGEEYFVHFDRRGDSTINTGSWYNYDFGPYQARLFGWSHTRRYAGGFLCNGERGCAGKMKLQIHGLDYYQQYSYKLYMIGWKNHYVGRNRVRIETIDEPWRWVENVRWGHGYCHAADSCPYATRGLVQTGRGPLVFRFHRDSTHVHLSGISIKPYCGPKFSAFLAARNGVGAKMYEFQVVTEGVKGGDMKERMRKSCNMIGMVPVCDHPSYCRHDLNSMYIGQNHHLAYAPHRNHKGYIPQGFYWIRDNWERTCGYTAGHGGTRALCNIPRNTHSWQGMQHNGANSWVCGRVAPFLFPMQAKNGVKERAYEFFSITTDAYGKRFETIMRETCQRIGAKPLCDHPSYCKEDANAVYIGQNHHISHWGHRHNSGYFPHNWRYISHYFDYHCFYTKNAHHGQALCDNGRNSHHWRTISEHSNRIACARAWRPEPITRSLSARNGVPNRRWEFQRLYFDNIQGNIKDLMRIECGRIGMKPVCDHPHYCRSDPRSYYIGQNSHLEYPGHRNNRGFWPEGWMVIRKYFDYSCAYTAGHGGANALCNVPGNTHAWANYLNKGGTSSFGGVDNVVCAQVAPITAKLGGRRYVPARTYVFQIKTTAQRGGNWRNLIVRECNEIGMKPVCDHPHWCATHRGYYEAIYLGQAHHIAFPGHRNNNGFFPSGWAAIRDYWSGLCSYSASSGKGAICNYPLNTHTWENPNDKMNSFMCAKVAPFSGTLGSRNGVPRRTYEFQHVVWKTKWNWRINSAEVYGCADLGKGWKPVCDHKSYCRNDPLSIYLGQDHHLAYPGHRNNLRYWPTGWDKIKDNWFNMCSYTGTAHNNGHHTLCNINYNTHSWQSLNWGTSWICARVKEFSAMLGAKRGMPKRRYIFKPIKTPIHGGKRYNNIMISECAAVGMKPICDHRSYCQNDPKSIYVGQEHHIAYKPHRNNAGYYPAGFTRIRDNWDGKCAYTAQHGTGALCNVPRNTHSWRNSGPGWDEFVCVQVAPFTVILGGKNGAPEGRYEFKIVTTGQRQGKFSTIMELACDKFGMKPVCDHPNHCGKSKQAIYIGQDSNISLDKDRKEAGGFPAGWNEIKDNFFRVCVYAGTQRGGKALCNWNGGHSWRDVSDSWNTFVCARTVEFRQKLGKKNGIAERTYTFQVVKTDQRGVRFSDAMVKSCKSRGMKPVCDHPNYCKSDVNALYIGQSHHIAYRPHRYNTAFFPKKWTNIRAKWDGLCSYTGKHGTGALCNRPANTHSWQHLSDFTDTFMCARVSAFSAKLGSRNGVPRGRYEFKIVQTDIRSGKFSAAQISECKKYGMKPICDHRSYCRNDVQAIYLGQDHHLAYRPHRLNKGYWPRGWDKLARNWDGLCSYTGRHGPRDHTLCNIPSNTHSWQKLSDKTDSFVCGRALKGAAAGKNALYDGKTFKDPLAGWDDMDEFTTCGYMGKILGGPNTLGKNDRLKKVYTLPCQRSVITITFKFARIDGWSNAEAWFKINGKKHWSKKGHQKNGRNGCGKGTKDELWSVNVKDLGMKGRTMTMEIGVAGIQNLKRDAASWGIKDFQIKVKCEGCGEEINRGRNRVKAIWAKKHNAMNAKVQACDKQVEARKKQLAHHKKRTEAHRNRAGKCKQVFEGYRKERDSWQRQRDAYRRERDMYRKKRDGFRQQRDGYRSQRDNFRRQRDSYKKQRLDAGQKGGGAQRDCERKREARERYWTNRMKNRNAEWEKRIKGLEKNKTDREKEWNRKFTTLQKETNEVRKQRDDYNQKKAKYKNQLKACQAKRRNKEANWRKKYARKERFWDRRLKDKRGAATKTKRDWERKLDNAQKAMDRRVAACKKDREDRLAACNKDRDNRLKRWKDKYESREKYWRKRYADLQAENIKKANMIKKRIADCKTERAKNSERCKKRLMKCQRETEKWKSKMIAFKEKAENAKESRRAADAAFKKMGEQVRVMERRYRKCEAKKQDREMYHMKRFHKMKAKHSAAINKHEACKKAHKHNEYLERNYKNMFKMVRGHADDLKGQRDKARAKSEVMLKKLSAYQKKCGDLEIVWNKKLTSQNNRAETAYRAEKRAKRKAAILETKEKKLQAVYDKLARKKGESDKKYQTRLKELKKDILKDQDRMKLSLKRKKKMWSKQASRIKKRADEDNAAYKARMDKEKSKFDKEEGEIQKKWNKIEAKMKRKKDESEASYRKRLQKAEDQYHKAARFISRYKAEKEAHRKDVKALKKKISESQEKSREVKRKQGAEIKKAQATLDREQKLRKTADLEADKYKQLAKAARGESTRADDLLSKEKETWKKKVKKLEDANLVARKKLFKRTKKFRRQMSKQEKEFRSKQITVDKEWKKRISKEKESKAGVDVEKIRSQLEKNMKKQYLNQIEGLKRKQTRTKEKGIREVKKMKEDYDSTKEKYKRKVARLERKHEKMGDSENNKRLTKENRKLKRKLDTKCGDYTSATKKSSSLKKKNKILLNKLEKRGKEIIHLEDNWRAKQVAWQKNAEQELEMDEAKIESLTKLIETLQGQLRLAVSANSAKLSKPQIDKLQKETQRKFDKNVSKKSNDQPPDTAEESSVQAPGKDARISKIINGKQ